MPHRPRISASVRGLPVLATLRSVSVTRKLTPVSAAFFAGHCVVRVLEQFVNETALVVVRDLGFLTGILAKPDGACAVDVQRLVADALKKPIAVRGQS